MYPPVTASPCQPPLGKGALGTGDGLPRVPCALAMTEAERICVSFRDQSADWSWESVIPLHKGRGERIATASVRTGFAMTHYKKCGTNPAGGCGHRPLRNSIGKHFVGAGFYPARGRGRAPPLRTPCYASVGATLAVARPHRTTCNAPVGTDVTGCGNPFLPPHIHPFPLLSYFPPGCARTIHK